MKDEFCNKFRKFLLSLAFRRGDATEALCYMSSFTHTPVKLEARRNRKNREKWMNAFI
jgi:hypothetical protein